MGFLIYRTNLFFWLCKALGGADSYLEDGEGFVFL